MVASATSYTCDPSPKTAGSSSMGEDPGVGHPQRPISTMVHKKETDDVPQTTGMATSEILALLPFTPDRYTCSWPGPILKDPLPPQGYLPHPLGPTTPPLTKCCIEG